jgi:hypothetical protein
MEQVSNIHQTNQETDALIHKRLTETPTVNAEVRTYTCVHVRKGKVVVEAKTTYAAAVEASNIWRLKTGTSGIDVYPHKE